MRGTAQIEGLLREGAPQALAATLRRFGDFAASEDAVQEAMIEAAERWPARGVPENPTGWLVHVAARRMTDRIRAEMSRRRREEEVAADRAEPAAAPPPEPGEQAGGGDDSLALVLMCCHPALSPASAIALTLRAVGGLTTTEIAGAFLVPEATVGQRISRAKQTVRASGEPFGLPGPGERAARMRAALRVLYLVFNEGYAASGGEALVRVDLSAEAIRLARMVHAAAPEEPEATGLLALMLLTDARRPARTGPAGQLVPLEEQDRSRWSRATITEGEALLAAAVSRGAVGEYQLQAAIAAVHDRAPSAEATDWAEIVALYGLLEGVAPSPMAALSRAIAVAMVDGPDAGLALIDVLAPELAGSHRLHAARAHLLERRGDAKAALAEYDKAGRLTTSVPERDYLTMRAARLRAG
jgi:RNA polymerase sigma factor (sigma-70 family)